MNEPVIPGGRVSWFARSLQAAALLYACISLPGIGTVSVRADVRPSVTKTEQPAARRGLHFVFDASGSMCGYLMAQDPAHILLDIIKYAQGLKDAEKNNKSMLIRQHAKVASVKDLVETPLNFAALVDSAAVTPGASCTPFDGKHSNVDLAFAAPAGTIAPRSIVMVSDMQLGERSATSFVDHFRTWARAQDPSQTISAGLVTLAVPFKGRYYSVSERDPLRRDEGYLLPHQTRPLALLWFLVGTEDISRVHALLGKLGVLQPKSPSLLYGLQLLPMPTTEPSKWLQGTEPLNSAAQLFGEPVHRVRAPNSDRSPRMVGMCASAAFVADSLVVRAERQCRDGKPFFESVNALEVSLPVDASRGVDVTSAGPGIATSGNVLTLTLARNWPAERQIPLTLKAGTPEVDPDSRLQKLTLNNDSCATRPVATNAAAGAGKTWQQRCAEQLSGKTYRLDELVLQLAARANDVLNEQVSQRRMILNVTFER